MYSWKKNKKSITKLERIQNVKYNSLAVQSPNKLLKNKVFVLLQNSIKELITLYKKNIEESAVISY